MQPSLFGCVMVRSSDVHNAIMLIAVLRLRFVYVSRSRSKSVTHICGTPCREFQREASCVLQVEFVVEEETFSTYINGDHYFNYHPIGMGISDVQQLNIGIEGDVEIQSIVILRKVWNMTERPYS